MDLIIDVIMDYVGIIDLAVIIIAIVLASKCNHFMCIIFVAVFRRAASYGLRKQTYKGNCSISCVGIAVIYGVPVLFAYHCGS